MPKAKYDVNEITKGFLNHKFPERAALMVELGNAIRDSLAIKHLSVEAIGRAIECKQNPAQLFQLGLLYGMALGTLMEKERQGIGTIIQ